MVNKIISRKTLKYVIITISAFLILTIAGFFLLRSYILKNAITRVKSTVEARTNLILTIGSAEFTGLSTVNINNISLVPANRDTLFRLDSVRVTVKLLPAVIGKVRLSEMSISGADLFLRKDSVQTNFNNLFKSSGKSASQKETDFAQSVYEKIKTLLRYLPDDVRVRNAKLTTRINDTVKFISLNNLDWVNKKFAAVINPQNSQIPWLAEGYFDKYKIQGEITISSPVGVDVYFTSYFKSVLQFKKLQLQVNKLDYKNKTLLFEGKGEVDSLRVYNAKISADTVIFGKTGGTIKNGITRNYITVDSSSVFKINDIMLSAFAQYPVGNEKLYELKVNMPKTPAQTFFNSLPSGMFNSFADIQAKGNLSYRLDCKLDGAMPDSVEFTSVLKKENFEIIKYGKENFARINEPFMHTVYEGGKPLRSFLVGPENPEFTPLENISVHFKNAVLINEDPSFFFHHGFIPQSFREAIAEVYKAGFKFVRGGSTISMQLVKNVYLERKKTIARKAEEALIVWLIESNRISSKERMFEVYLNIIEMAPGVYGIGEGSRFYFNKRPADLTLAEGIYLSNIIPRPKAFKYGFEKDGTLKPWLQEKTKLVIRRMVQREWLPATDTLGFSPLVQVKGLAKNYIVPVDSLLTSPQDTIGDDDFFIR